jgi:hypothetical protein
MGGGPSSSTTQKIPKELRPLFEQTGQFLTGLQPEIVGQAGQFFGDQTQQIPGLTSGQQDIMALQRQRAFGNPMTAPEQQALDQINFLTGGPLGSSPATIAAMDAVRNPVLNDLALAGLGNSDAIGSNLAGAYAPILAQEQAMRAGVIPQLTGLGNTLANRQSNLLSEYGASEEQGRGIEEARGQATLQDLLRRQGLFTDFTTGILGGFPKIGSTKTTSSGGGIGK